MSRRRWPDQIYVAGFQDGSAVKIGCSANPAKRTKALEAATGRPMHLFWSEWTECAQLVEAVALGILEPNRIKGEWFAVSPEAAIDAAKAALRIWHANDALDFNDPKHRWPPTPNSVRHAAMILTARRKEILEGLNHGGWIAAADLAREFARDRNGGPATFQTQGQASRWAREIMWPMISRGTVLHDETADTYSITDKGRERLRRGIDPGGGHPE
jgi:hypothetical protein